MPLPALDWSLLAMFAPEAQRSGWGWFPWCLGAAILLMLLSTIAWLLGGPGRGARLSGPWESAESRRPDADWHETLLPTCLPAGDAESSGSAAPPDHLALLHYKVEAVRAELDRICKLPPSGISAAAVARAGQLLRRAEMALDAWDAETADRALVQCVEALAGALPVGVPAPDPVHFSVTSPAAAAPASRFLLNVWAHLERQRQEVLLRAQRQTPGEAIAVRTKGPVELKRGEVLVVCLSIEELVVEDPQDTIVWTGDVGCADFAVRVPEGARPGAHAGVARIYAAGLQVARLHFLVEVGTPKPEPTALPVEQVRHRTAFASYAHADRDAVLGRVQGMCKVMPDLEVFLDVMSLRSGEDWEERLRRVIPASDVFYLFWSKAAAQSEWVEREWRIALEAKGPDFVDPVPLVSPELVPPPPELSGKHFNDWVLAYQRG